MVGAAWEIVAASRPGRARRGPALNYEEKEERVGKLDRDGHFAEDVDLVVGSAAVNTQAVGCTDETVGVLGLVDEQPVSATGDEAGEVLSAATPRCPVKCNKPLSRMSDLFRRRPVPPRLPTAAWIN